MLLSPDYPSRPLVEVSLNDGLRVDIGAEIDVLVPLSIQAPHVLGLLFAVPGSAVAIQGSTNDPNPKP